jgi:hypothetical protein
MLIARGRLSRNRLQQIADRIPRGVMLIVSCCQIGLMGHGRPDPRLAEAMLRNSFLARSANIVLVEIKIRQSASPLSNVRETCSIGPRCGSGSYARSRSEIILDILSETLSASGTLMSR